jgi:hypothetical protein
LLALFSLFASFSPLFFLKKCRAQASDVAPPRSASVDFDARAPRPNERVDPSMLLVASLAGVQSRAALREKAKRFSKCTDTLTPEMVTSDSAFVIPLACLSRGFERLCRHGQFL